VTAAWIWARAELRARWKAWLLLGLLAGATVGVAAAGFAGARRTAHAIPSFVAAAHLPTAAVLANDPQFDSTVRTRVSELPGVVRTYPFMVGVATEVFSPAGLGEASSRLFPTNAAAIPIMTGPLVAGRLPAATRADEVVVDENARDRFHLGLGSQMVVGQPPVHPGEIPPQFEPPAGALAFKQKLRVVGIAKSVSSDPSWTASSGFVAKYGTHMPQFVNLLVDLRGGAADIPDFTRRVTALVGHPLNVEDTNDLFGIRKAKNVTDLERDGLLIFAFAALLGGGVLVGQALVRAVSASAADLPTWRALGADRALVLRALTLPAMLAGIVAVLSSLVVAIALSARFPLGTARTYDLDVGTHADWLVLGLAALAVLIGVVLVAGAAAWWQVAHRVPRTSAPSSIDRIVAPMSRAPALMVGARLAIEPGRGRRAVPVRSAFVGALAGVLGVVACLTFRAGVEDAIAQPRRSGVVWNFGLAAGGSTIPDATVHAVSGDRQVADAVHATWYRAVTINGHPVPMFGTRAIAGTLPFVMLLGHPPRGTTELVLAPTTLHELHLSVGDSVQVGASPGRRVRVVGEALLPATSHTDYDQSAWMTSTALSGVVNADNVGDDYLFVRWRAGTNAAAAQRNLVRIGGSDLFPVPATLPVAVADLARLSDLPLALAVFFALLACATVAHALVTTVRRRRHDLAVLRSLGFTRRQTRGAIAWQATLLAVAGIVVGVPLGIVAGRIAWRALADDFPIAYAPPLAAFAVVLVTAVALLLANALAAGPAYVAARIRPAEALRVE